MKNIILGMLFFLLGSGVYAQEGVKIGIQGGLPVNEFNDVVGVMVGVEAGYMWALGKTVDLGAKVGFINGFPEKFNSETVLIDLPNVQFLPLAGSVRIWPSRSFALGVDAGYAVGINEGNDGGLYYRPLIGYLMGPKTQLNFSYTGISLEEQSWATVTMGIIYTFPSKRSRF